MFFRFVSYLKLSNFQHQFGPALQSHPFIKCCSLQNVVVDVLIIQFLHLQDSMWFQFDVCAEIQ